MKTFCSFMAKQMNRFVAIKCLSGTEYKSQTRILSYFDHFLVTKQFKAPFPSRDIVDQYLETLSNLTERSWYNRFSVIKQFCKYLSQFEPLCYVPDAIRSPTSRFSRQPYIYTENQISELLAKASALPPPSILRPHTYSTLFGLLYTTGIRIGEALALNVGDIYINKLRLHIREGKFHKQRWVPLSPSTCVRLARYMDKRSNVIPNNSEAPFFISARKNRLSHCTVHSTLRILLEQCNIHTGKGSAPRIHDFSYPNLNKIQTFFKTA